MKFEITERKLRRKLKGKVSVFSATEEIAFAKYCIERKNMLVEEIKVDERHRGKNVGTAVVNILKEFAKRKGCKSLWLYSLLNAVEFWKKMGFVVTCVNQMEFKVGTPHTTELMRKMI